MLFSVIVPTYNRVNLLAGTLGSIWRQRFEDYEVIVVDDGSNDETQQYLRGLSKRIRAVTQPNLGPGAARNAGVRAARGDYMAFLDSDDVWFPWTLDTFARAIHHCQPQILSGDFIEFRHEGELSAIQEQPYEATLFSDYIASSRHPYSVGSGTCVLHRDVFAKGTFLEDRLNAEDHDLILQLGTIPGFLRILSPITLAWRRHPTSETGNLPSSIAGARRLLARETSAAYPGGSNRSLERRRILARHVRPTALACVRQGELKQGWALYRSTLHWNAKLGHWKYVFAFPVLVALAFLGRAIVRLHRPA